MLLEGKIDISGSTVKIDTSNELKGRIILALEKYNDEKYDEVDEAVEEIIKMDPHVSDAWYLKALLYRFSSTEKSDKYYKQAIEESNHSLGIVDETKYKKMYGHILTIKTKRGLMNTAKSFNVWLNEKQIAEGCQIGTPFNYFLMDGNYKLRIKGLLIGDSGKDIEVNITGDHIIEATYSNTGKWTINRNGRIN